MSLNVNKTSFDRFLQTYKYCRESISYDTDDVSFSSEIGYEDVYLTDFDSDSSSVLGPEYDYSSNSVAPSPIKMDNFNIWDASCCICISPIVSRKGHGSRPTMEPRTVPTMWAIGNERICRIYETFN